MPIVNHALAIYIKKKKKINTYYFYRLGLKKFGGKLCPFRNIYLDRSHRKNTHFMLE
jgi:hypothetical protein